MVPVSLADLAARLGGPDGEVPGLQVVRPSLEDIYLDLIGHTDLDAEVDAALPTVRPSTRESVR